MELFIALPAALVTTPLILDPVLALTSLLAITPTPALELQEYLLVLLAPTLPEEPPLALCAVLVLPTAPLEEPLPVCVLLVQVDTTHQARGQVLAR